MFTRYVADAKRRVNRGSKQSQISVGVVSKSALQAYSVTSIVVPQQFMDILSVRELVLGVPWQGDSDERTAQLQLYRG